MQLHMCKCDMYTNVCPYIHAYTHIHMHANTNHKLVLSSISIPTTLARREPLIDFSCKYIHKKLSVTQISYQIKNQ